MTSRYEHGLNHPPIDDLTAQAGSKYALVVVAAKRARQVNSYYQGLAEGILEYVGPTVETTPGDQPLTIALREVASGHLDVTATERRAGDKDGTAEASPYRPQMHSLDLSQETEDEDE